jgi:hypothetical protein
MVTGDDNETIRFWNVLPRLPITGDLAVTSEFTDI